MNEKIRAVLPIITPMVREGLILLQDVEVIPTGSTLTRVFCYRR